MEVMDRWEAIFGGKREGSVVVVPGRGVWERLPGEGGIRVLEEACPPPGSVYPPVMPWPVEQVEAELREKGACDVGFDWGEEVRIVASFRKAGGRTIAEFFFYPKDPPRSAPREVVERIRPGRFVLVGGTERRERVVLLASLAVETAERGWVVESIEDPVVFSPRTSHGLLIQREVGVAGDVPSFREGIRQATGFSDAVFVSDVGDPGTARAIVEAVLEGVAVCAALPGKDEADTKRRFLVRLLEGVEGSLREGLKETVEEKLEAVVVAGAVRF